MVLALAGRRMDAPEAEERRFPPDQVRRVAAEIHDILQRFAAKILVCSAACGADLLALQAAEAIGVRRRVVLPFNPDQFRETSVADRPGNWGELYDQVLDSVRKRDDLVVLGLHKGDPNAYETANRRIFKEAKAQAQATHAAFRALVVWEGKSRGQTDTTAQFWDLAPELGFPRIEILSDGVQA